MYYTLSELMCNSIFLPVRIDTIMGTHCFIQLCVNMDTSDLTIGSDTYGLAISTLALAMKKCLRQMEIGLT